jgi:predicted amidohydrolase
VQAMQSSVYIAMCNRVGKEDRMEFVGQSLVADPNGDVVAKAGANEPGQASMVRITNGVFLATWLWNSPCFFDVSAIFSVFTARTRISFA